MESTGSGIFGRLGERVLGWIALGVLIAIVVGIFLMDPVARTSIWQGIWRSMFWVLIVATLPWAGRFFLRRILEMRTNWASVGLLAAFTVVDLGVGLVLMSGCDVTVAAKQAVIADEEKADEPALPKNPPTSLTDAAREAAAEALTKMADTIAPDEEADPLAANAEPGGEASDENAEDERSSSGWFWFACLTALAVAGTYNYLVTEYLAEMAGG